MTVRVVVVAAAAAVGVVVVAAVVVTVAAVASAGGGVNNSVGGSGCSCWQHKASQQLAVAAGPTQAAAACDNPLTATCCRLQCPTAPSPRPLTLSCPLALLSRHPTNHSNEGLHVSDHDLLLYLKSLHNQLDTVALHPSAAHMVRGRAKRQDQAHIGCRSCCCIVGLHCDSSCSTQE